MGERKRRCLAAAVERLESRELLSGLIAALGSSGPPAPSPGALIDRTEAASTSSSNAFPPGNYPLLGQGTPSPRELARERFFATFQGPVYVGPGRFSDQSKIIYMRGEGGSNFFEHGDYQMAIVYSTDPNAGLTGEAYMQDKNNNSGAQVAFVLKGSPTKVDRLGRPTQMTFNNDLNIYSGIFYSDAATGTVTIRYSKGSARAIFKGLVYTTGITNPLRNTDLVGRGGRITPRSGR